MVFPSSSCHNIAMEIYIVHAFTDKVFGGNPAGVVLLSHEEAFPETNVCIKIAAELRYSETVFIKKEEHFTLRYFTPTDEVPLCGHATIAASHILLKKHPSLNNTTFLIDTLSGLLPITIEDSFIWMTMGKPEIRDFVFSKSLENDLYKIMGIKNPDLPLKPKIVSTGLADIILPVKDVNEITPDYHKLSRFSKDLDVVGVHAFSQGEGEVTCHTRNFAPLYGIPEEAATGTASGALTYYLYDQGLIEKNSSCLFLQGEAMKRPSLIKTRIKNEDAITIETGGKAVVFQEGKLNL